jgi:hypothetical protein
MIGFVVLTSIQFNDEVVIQANKVDDEAAQWMLSTELETREATVPQLAPDERFGFAWVFPQVLRMISASGHAHAPLF